MLFIEEKSNDENAVTIYVDGIIDSESLQALVEVIGVNQREKLKITLNLKGLMHINRAGIAYLKKHRDKITLEEVSEYLKMEIGL